MITAELFSQVDDDDDGDDDDDDDDDDVYSVCSLVVPRLEEAILTPVLKKIFK